MTQNNENRMANGAPMIDEKGLRYAARVVPEKLAEFQSESGWRNNDMIRWFVPGTRVIATLALRPSAADDGTYRVSLGLCPEGSDREVSCYLSKGAREEMVEYLKSPEGQEEVFDTVKDLWKDLWEES